MVVAFISYTNSLSIKRYAQSTRDQLLKCPLPPDRLYIITVLAEIICLIIIENSYALNLIEVFAFNWKCVSYLKVPIVVCFSFETEESSPKPLY
jgi:hypothetical protein